MIYELALVAKAELPENELEALSEMVKDVLKEGSGELFIEDDWGKLNLGQPTSKGVRRGFFKYFIFKLDPQVSTVNQKFENFLERTGRFPRG